MCYPLANLYTYNALGLVTNKKVPFAVDNDGNMQYTNYSYSYDSIGNVKNESVTSGVINTYTYDYRNRVTQAKSGVQVVNYTYDAVGNMTEYKIANDEDMVHTYTYDSLNRVASYTDALGNSESYTYDSNQDMIKKVDRNGNTITYTYDGLHRILTETADGVSNSWTYGLTGGVLTETNASTAKTYTYNSAGLVSNETTKIGSDTFKITRSYDTRGNNVLNKYYKNGTQYEQIKNTYDNKNRLYEVSVATGTSSTFASKVKYYYDKNDNVTSAHYGNNTYQVYYYNAANLIHCMDMVDKSDGSMLEHLVYRYRLDGNMSGKTETYNGNTTTTAYTYDTTGRLTKENVISNSETFAIAYTYDNAGNRSTMTLSGYAGNSTENYSYDKNNRLVSSVKDIGTISYYTDYTYDKNGNQTKIEKYTKNNNGVFKLSIVSAISKSNIGIEEFTYNSLNQLTGYESITGQYNNRAGLSAEYEYMANGYRLSKTVNDLETRYLWDGDNITSELNDENTITQNYYRGYNLICDDSDIYYMHDIHGNVIETYDGTSKYCDNWYIYNAYGTTKYFDNTDSLNEIRKWGYCDQLYDFETGNYYMRARYYNPDTGRFISEDPIKDGINWYAYCNNNPITNQDINGLTSVADAENIIKDNASAIKAAGERFQVNPAIIAGCIYTEQTTNVGISDAIIDPMAAQLGVDVSLGIGQVRLSTAKMLEDNWYMPKIQVDSKYLLRANSAGGGPTMIDVEASIRASKLMDDETNIQYVAAYLSYIQNLWEDVYPEIDGKSDILGTLYNVGEYGSQNDGPKSNPESNKFGDTVKNNYYKMQSLLGL